MEAAAIREAVRKRPFQPFTIVLADKREIVVPNPEFVAVAPNGRRVVAFDEDGAMSVLEPLLILSLEVPAAPSTGGGAVSANGD